MQGLTKITDTVADLKLDAGDVLYKHPTAPGAKTSPIANRFVYELDAVADYLADPTGAADSYAALQALADDCKTVKWVTAKIDGQFKISAPVLFKDLTGLNIDANCYIYPTFNTGDYVVGICNAQGVRTHGRFEVSGQNKLGIKSGFKFWSDNANGFSFCEFFALCVSDALVGITLGDIAYPSALISELAFHGGYTVGTPCSILAIGTQCYINFIGFNAVSGGVGALAPVTQYTVRTKGAQVKFIGGEIQHNNNIFGAAVLVEPVIDPTYGNTYGNIEVGMCHLESAAAHCMIANLDGVPSPISTKSGVSFHGIHGFHSQDNGPLYFVHTASAADYAGRITTRDITLTRNGADRVQPNISAGALTHVYYDEAGFGTGFVKGLQAVQGGILHFSRRPVCVARNAAGQTLTTTPNTVLWSEFVNTDDSYRWNAQYSTGTFTVPAGGLKDVQVHAVARINVGVQLSMDVFVNGSVQTLSIPAVGSAEVNAFLGDLAAGATVQVRASVNTGSAQLNGGTFEKMTITAAR